MAKQEKDQATQMTETTVVAASTAWERMNQRDRKSLVWSLWFATWIGLLMGYKYAGAWDVVVIFSVLHAIVFWVLFGYRIEPFPVQVRNAYALWVATGTYFPYMQVLMYITTVGLAANLFAGYCPLARMMTLLPWNREEALTFNFVNRVFLSPPSKGRFQPPTAAEKSKTQ